MRKLLKTKCHCSIHLEQPDIRIEIDDYVSFLKWLGILKQKNIRRIIIVTDNETIDYRLKDTTET